MELSEIGGKYSEYFVSSVLTSSRTVTTSLIVNTSSILNYFSYSDHFPSRQYKREHRLRLTTAAISAENSGNRSSQAPPGRSSFIH